MMKVLLAKAHTAEDITFKMPISGVSDYGWLLTSNLSMNSLVDAASPERYSGVVEVMILRVSMLRPRTTVQEKYRWLAIEQGEDAIGSNAEHP